MPGIHASIAEIVGNTPLVELTNCRRRQGIASHIIGKLECVNPSGSVKDRLAVALINEGFEKGLLTEGSTLINVTSGNTGIALAAIGHARGLNFIPHLEPGTTQERIAIFNGYGLDTHSFTDIEEIADFEEKGLALDDLIRGIRRIADEQGHVYAGQTVNEANQEYHCTTTGPEIWEDTQGAVDYFVATAGTGGTLLGASGFLKAKNPEVKIIAVQADEPSRPGSSDFTGNTIDGTLPVGNVPDELVPTVIRTNLDNSYFVDEVIDVAAEDAYRTAQDSARSDGLFLGTSAAAALTAAIEIAKRPEAQGKNIVAVCPDTVSHTS